MYGGALVDGSVLGDVWTWNGRAWAKAADTTRLAAGATLCETPWGLVTIGGTNKGAEVKGMAVFKAGKWQMLSEKPPVDGNGFAVSYDEHRKRLVCFGSFGTSEPSVHEWDGKAWHSIAARGPGPRFGHVMVYDAGKKRTVLFGGNSGGQVKGDTWSWDGKKWQLLTNTGPSARILPGACYNGSLGKVMLFGGIGQEFLGDTWMLDDHVWKRVHGPAPSARGVPAMAYDKARMRVVLYGGDNEKRNLRDTWEFGDGEWALKNAG